MIRFMKFEQSIKTLLTKFKLNFGALRMLNVLVSVLFINHLLSCIWFYAAKLDGFNPDTWVFRMDLIDSDPFTQYIASYYWAFQTLTTVGYGDIHPVTSTERIIGITWMITGVGFYSFTIGNLSNILANIDKRALKLKVFIVTYS